MKNNVVTAPNAKMRTARKNEANLPITSAIYKAQTET